MCRRSAKMSSLTGQHKCHIPSMENVTLNPERTDETPGSEQLAGGAHDDIGPGSHADGCKPPGTPGVSWRPTGREGAAALAHGHRGRKAPNATPDVVVATDVVHLARTRYAGANHTHLSELLSEARRHRHLQDHPAAYPGQRWAEQSAAKASAQTPGPPGADAPERVCCCRWTAVTTPGWKSRGPSLSRVAVGGGRCHRYGGRRPLLRAGGRPQLLPADSRVS